MAVHEYDGKYQVVVGADTFSRVQPILAENGCKLKVHVTQGNGNTLLRARKYGTKADVYLLPSAEGKHGIVFGPVGLFSKSASRQLCQELAKLIDEHSGAEA